MATTQKHDIDLGALQSKLATARKLHTTNEKILKRALDAHRKSRAEREACLQALEAATNVVLG